MTLKKIPWMLMQLSTILLYILLIGFGYLLQRALIGWGLFLALMVLHFLEIKKAKSVGHSKGLSDRRIWLKNMLFGFTWWLPLERGIFDK